MYENSENETGQHIAFQKPHAVPRDASPRCSACPVLVSHRQLVNGMKSEFKMLRAITEMQSLVKDER